jgi:hypothetical protein
MSPRTVSLTRRVLHPRTILLAGALVLTPSAAAQVGLGSPAGGILVIMLAGAFLLFGGMATLIGAALLLRNGPSLWRVALLVGGLAALAPGVWVGLWIAVPLFEDLIPRTESWDFSTSRSVAALDLKRRNSVERSDRDSEYYFQGNIRSTIRLPEGRQFSGRGSLVIVEALRGQVTVIDWRGRQLKTPDVFEETQRILRELRIPGRQLDDWYAKLRAGQHKWFTAESPGLPRVQVHIRKLPGEAVEVPIEDREWYVNVYADWSPAK